MLGPRTRTPTTSASAPAAGAKSAIGPPAASAAAGAGAGAVSPIAPAGDPQIAALSHLLAIEADARLAPSVPVLMHLLVNETRALVRARQAFVMRRRLDGSFRVGTVSSVALVDRNTPLIQWVEALIRTFAKRTDLSRLAEFTLPGYADPNDPFTTSYPFQNMLWVPLWAQSGRALYYRTPAGIVSVAVTTGATFSIGDRHVVIPDIYEKDGIHANYDVAPDGSRFLMLKPAGEDAKVTVVHNWGRELREKLAAGKK